jgi:hypothetical protein
MTTAFNRPFTLEIDFHLGDAGYQTFQVTGNCYGAYEGSQREEPHDATVDIDDFSLVQNGTLYNMNMLIPSLTDEALDHICMCASDLVP